MSPQHRAARSGLRCRRLIAGMVFGTMAAPSACGGSADDDSLGVRCTKAGEIAGGYERCGEGFVHRARTGECPLSERRAACDPATASLVLCTTDTECDHGPHGYCDVSGDRCLCNYPCVVDADCGEDMICVCVEAQGGVSGVCELASCRTDADCNGTFCAKSSASGKFACFSPKDECRFEGDCDAGYQCGFVGDVRQCFPEGTGATRG